MSGLRQIHRREEARGLYQEYLRRIDAEAVLEHYGADNCHRQGNEIIHSCLLDRIESHHSHGDRNPSASMNVEKKVYNCYSYGGGDIFWFVQKMEGASDFSEIVPLLGDFLTGSTQSADDFLEELDKYLSSDEYAKTSMPRYHERVLRQWGYYHPYLRDRGISFEAAHRLSLGYDMKRVRIVIPHWVDGVLVGWQARALTDPRYPVTQVELNAKGEELDGGTIPKIKSSSGFPKDTTLYNLDRVKARGKDDLVVVESPLSVATAESLMENDSDILAGAVATFGASVTKSQMELLRPFSNIYVYMDDDTSGMHGAITLIENLYRHTNVFFVQPEKGKDLGDYKDREQVIGLLENAELGVLALDRLNRRMGRAVRSV